MRRQRVEGPMSRWQQWRWELADVVDNEAAFGSVARMLVDDAHEQRWLHPGFEVELFRDDAEGYFLNITTDAPCWFVMWRMQEQASLANEPMAIPHRVTLSYNDAGRWLDAQEMVEQVQAPALVVRWMQEFVDAHHVVEPKRRRRPESFRSLSDRFGNPASISTGKKSGRGHG